MENTYNSLKNVFLNLKKETNQNALFVPTLLVLLSIPLSFAINNIALGIYLFIALITFKKDNFSFQTNLFLPILLYLIMAVSFFWSIDPKSTLTALSKEIALLIIPIVFLASKDFLSEQKQKIIAYFSYGMVILALYYLFKAIIRFCLTQDSRVFFYHGENDDDFGLVPKLLNAIHVSVFVAVAFFYFFTKKAKSNYDLLIAGILFGFLLLLSSKNIILVVLFLILIHVFFFSKAAHKMRLRNIILFGLILAMVFSFGRIKERFKVEFQNNSDKSLTANVIEGIPVSVHILSIKEAWTNDYFTPNDYFPGTAFRVYQLRIFTELMTENNVFLTGFGLNASYPKIKEKAIEHNVYLGKDGKEGYQNKNFHNQYLQNFSELGFFGFFVLVIMLFINVKNTYISKDFVHFAFSILMISLFLTESFLWRQRGVVFFTLLYCLFNSKTALKDSE